MGNGQKKELVHIRGEGTSQKLATMGIGERAHVYL